MSLAAGARLGPYQVVSPLGAGGMGEVYRARDERLGREVALKVLPGSLTRDEDRLRRFEHEARAAGNLNHPGLLTIFDVGTCDGSPYIVSELLGNTLRSVLEARPAVTQGAGLVVQFARGLAAAHEKDIVHRDLKPENLFITRDGRAKILDFGLAKLSRASESRADETDARTATSPSSPGTVMGTVGYMSPEQGAVTADHRSNLRVCAVPRDAEWRAVSATPLPRRRPRCSEDLPEPQRAGSLPRSADRPALSREGPRSASVARDLASTCWHSPDRAAPGPRRACGPTARAVRRALRRACSRPTPPGAACHADSDARAVRGAR
jgi:serine/threonine protein kinase